MAAPEYIPPFDEMLQASADMGLWSNAPDLWRGCVGYWPLSEGDGGTAFDLARNNAGTWNGTGDHHAIGRLGRCGQFNGSDDYVQVGDPVLGNTSFTASIWFKRNSTGSVCYILDNGLDTDGGFQMFLKDDNTIRGRIDDGGSNGGTFDTVTTTDTSWHHIALVADKSDTAKLYLDGIQDGATLDISMYGDISGTANLRIGRKDGSHEYYFDGTLDDVRIHNRALTPSEILHLTERPHDMVTLRRPVTTVVMGGGGPPATNIPAIMHHRRLMGAA